MSRALALDAGVDIPAKRAGRIARKRGTNKLYVDFNYNGVRIERSTGLNDTPENYEKMSIWLDRQLEKIEKGTFVFSEAFPGATEEDKAFHAAREGWEYKPEPHNVLFENYVAIWRSTVLANDDSPIKKDDWNSIIDCWLLPYFGKMTFHQIHTVEIKKFLAQLKCQRGKRKGQAVSRSRAINIFVPLRAIWIDACEEHHWDLPDPFRFVKKLLPEDESEQPEGFRFDDWMQVVNYMDPFYVPHVEIMVMTGMIASELAGFRKKDIVDGELHITNSIAMGYEKEKLKTKYRKRCIPITKALQDRLDILLARSEGPYVFTMKDGSTFNNNAFRDSVWEPALENAGVKYRVPYALRHSHAAWSLAIGVDPNRLAYRMGHGSKQMVFEVYGSYIQGVETDKDKIRGYFGEDFS